MTSDVLVYRFVHNYRCLVIKKKEKREILMSNVCVLYDCYAYRCGIR